MSFHAPSRGPHFLPSHAIGTWPYPNSFIPAGWSNPGAAAYPTADLAIYVPIRVRQRVIAKKLFVSNGTVSGSICVAIYDAAGTQIVTSGTQTQAGASAEQVFDVTDATLGPGLYYVGVVLDNTTGQLLRYSFSAPMPAAWGVLTEQLGASAALPATATFALDQTVAFIPVAGMLLETTVA